MFNVEIFQNNRFLRWFPAQSFTEVLQTIQRLEGKINLADLAYSYLVFQETYGGSYKISGSGKDYHLVSRINSNGNERPYFLKKVK